MATTLSCADQLVVWSHARPNQPTEQHMKAAGNAYLQSQEYDGWGETIEVVGKTVIFEGEGSVPARIKNRFNGNDQTGKKIIFDRATNHYKVEGSLGGTLSPGATLDWEFLEPRNLLVGPPDHIAERVQELAEVCGLETLLVGYAHPGIPQRLILRNLELFATKVMPAFRPATTPLPAVGPPR